MAAEILLLDNDVSVDEATNILWRRETGRSETSETYTRGTSPNSVLVEQFADDRCVETVLYTDFNEVGKIDHPTAAELAAHAIQSATEAPEGKDGITYLADAITCGIETPLTSAYRPRTCAGLAQRPYKHLSRAPEMLPRALGRRPHMNDNTAGEVRR